MMSAPNVHYCEEMAIAEKKYGEGGIHLNHNFEEWSLTVVNWGEVVSIPVNFCPFCGKELPPIKRK